MPRALRPIEFIVKRHEHYRDSYLAKQKAYDYMDLDVVLSYTGSLTHQSWYGEPDPGPTKYVSTATYLGDTIEHANCIPLEGGAGNLFIANCLRQDEHHTPVRVISRISVQRYRDSILSSVDAIDIQLLTDDLNYTGPTQVYYPANSLVPIELQVNPSISVSRNAFLELLGVKLYYERVLSPTDKPRIARYDALQLGIQVYSRPADPGRDWEFIKG